MIQHDLSSQKEDAQENIERIRELGSVGGTLLDLGANIGEVSLQCADQFERVVAVESHPYTFDVLKERVKGSRKIVVVHAAIAPKSGLTYYASSPGYCAVDSNARPFKQFDGVNYYFPVKTADFNSMLASEQPTVVKMDIEGGEFACLERCVIPGSLKFLLVEFHGHRSMIRHCIDRLAIYQMRPRRDDKIFMDKVSPNVHLISLMFERTSK